MPRAPSDKILSRLMSLHPKIIDLTLDRMYRLLDVLDNPQNNLPPVIHIAGTNGKGSTQAMIRAGLEAENLRIHAYTSPHLARFHERITLAGHFIKEEYLSDILEECEKANHNDPITYFEITTCAAFLAFARNKADYTLLEVGLGGRLDATNVIDTPEITIITPISIDHQQYLGNSLAEIAGEKAGVLKSNCFAIIAPQPEEALAVIETQAAKVGATCKIHGQHWHVWEENDRLMYQDENGFLDLPMPVLIGAHQVQNAGTALATLRYLGKTPPCFEAALLHAKWPARLQILESGPCVQTAPQAEIWLDGGHNAAAGQALAEALGRLPARPLYLITGMLNTKDINAYMAPLAKHITTLFGVSIPHETASLNPEEIVDFARKENIDATSAPNVLSAVKTIAKREPTARILICGSLYLAGYILRDHA